MESLKTTYDEPRRKKLSSMLNIEASNRKPTTILSSDRYEYKPVVFVADLNKIDEIIMNNQSTRSSIDPELPEPRNTEIFDHIRKRNNSISDESNSMIVSEHSKRQSSRKSVSVENTPKTTKSPSFNPIIEENNSFSEEETEGLKEIQDDEPADIPTPDVSPIPKSNTPTPRKSENKDKRPNSNSNSNSRNSSILNSSDRRRRKSTPSGVIEYDDDIDIGNNSLPSPPSIIEEKRKSSNLKKRKSIKTNLSSNFDSVANDNDISNESDNNNNGLDNLSFTSRNSNGKKKILKSNNNNKTPTSSSKAKTIITPSKDSSKKNNKNNNNKTNRSYLNYSSFILDDSTSTIIDDDDEDNDYRNESHNISQIDEDDDEEDDELIVSGTDVSIRDTSKDNIAKTKTPRKRFKPLQYWKGEHLFISKSKVKVVDYGVKEPERKKRKTERKVVKKEKVKNEALEYPSDVEEDDPEHCEVTIGIDKNKNKIKSGRFRFIGDSDNIMSVSEGVRVNSGLTLKKCFTCGVFRIDPKHDKKEEKSKMSVIVMYVVSCQENSLIISIEDKKYLLREGNTLYVPKNVRYSLSNRSEKEEAVIHFTLIRNEDVE